MPPSDQPFSHDGRVASFRCPFHGWRWDLDGNLVEVIEVADHPWFIGCQFHPELSGTWGRDLLLRWLQGLPEGATSC